MKSAYAFYRDNFSVEEEFRGFCDGLVGVGFDGFTRRVGEGYLRAAVRAGDGLGVEPSVGDVGVLSLALRAHGEFGHGGVWAVVGDGFNYRISGAAVCAVDEGVAIAEIVGVGQFAEAIFAGCDVRSDLGKGCSGRIALTDEEFGFVGNGGNILMTY